jgi:hypothetical protein
LTEISPDPGLHYKEKQIQLNVTDTRTRGTYRSWRLALHCLHPIDCACQSAPHILELHPINVISTIRRKSIFNLLSKEDGIRVALILSGRREVENGGEGIIQVIEIVIAERFQDPILVEEFRHL